MNIRKTVLTAAAIVAVSRGLLVLSAPQVLATYDEATWKHGALARQLADGNAMDWAWFSRLITHPFNFHQAGFGLWNVTYAAIAEWLGTGFVQLHGWMALSAVLGAAAWTALLTRHGPPRAGWLVAAMHVAMPLPAALMSVRPWSGHTEAQAFAAAALALAWVPLGPMTNRRGLGVGILAGLAVSFSALALPLLGAACLAHLWIHRSLRPHGALLAGLLSGLSPLAIRSVLAQKSFWQMPVVESPESTPGAILQGDFGPELFDLLLPPSHLVFHAESISAAHSWQGVVGGDDPLANGSALAAGLACLWLSRKTTGVPKMILWTLVVSQVATLLMIGLAGPALTLRYLVGLYPIGAAALSWVLAAAGSAPRHTPARLAQAAAAIGFASWLVPGSIGLARTIEPARWALSLNYAPDAYTMTQQLGASPKLEDWDDALLFLTVRQADETCPSAMGFGLAFSPTDTRSALGWQPIPVLDAKAVDNLVDRARAQQPMCTHGANRPLQNLGWALAIAADWDARRWQKWTQALSHSDRKHLLIGAIEGVVHMGLDPTDWRLSRLKRKEEAPRAPSPDAEN